MGKSNENSAVEQSNQAYVQDKKSRQKAQGRINDPETNPCLKEHQLTTTCLADNKYDRTKCEIYFENYRECKQFWLNVQKDRIKKGIYPDLPPLAEREKIKEERRKKQNNL